MSSSSSSSTVHRSQSAQLQAIASGATVVGGRARRITAAVAALLEELKKGDPSLLDLDENDHDVDDDRAARAGQARAPDRRAHDPRPAARLRVCARRRGRAAARARVMELLDRVDASTALGGEEAVARD